MHDQLSKQMSDLLSFLRFNNAKVLEVGSLAVQESGSDFRKLATVNSALEYVGIDLVDGPNVSTVTDTSEKIPFQNETFSIVAAFNVFEHNPLFWKSFLEMLRVCRKDGVLILTVPGAGSVHRYPLDCWRFYPDSGYALQMWANEFFPDTVLLFSGMLKDSKWSDCILVFGFVNADTGLDYDFTALIKSCQECRVNGVDGIVNPAQKGRLFGEIVRKNLLSELTLELKASRKKESALEKELRKKESALEKKLRKKESALEKELRKKESALEKELRKKESALEKLKTLREENKNLRRR